MLAKTLLVHVFEQQVSSGFLVFSLSLQFIVLLSGLLIFQLEFFSSNFTISIPVLIGKHIFNNLLKIKARSQFSLASINLSLDVL